MKKRIKVIQEDELSRDAFFQKVEKALCQIGQKLSKKANSVELQEIFE